MQCNLPFSPLEVVLNNQAVAHLLEPVALIQLPVNLPPQLAQQVYNSILQQVQIVSVPPVDYDVFQATLECAWCKSEFHTKGKIRATRLPDMNIAVSVVPVSSQWTFSKTSGEPAQ
jgi:hypothetical protein